MERPGTPSTAATAAFTDAFRNDYPPIEDYASIGDGRTIALVSREGSIDWLCLPHFSAPSVFAAMLDRERGGSFVLRPTAPFSVERRYSDETNVLETRFETDCGTVLVTDCMTLLPAEKHHDQLRPQAEILRIVTGCSGTVEIEVICAPRADYGRARGMFEDRGELGWAYCCGDQVIFLQGEMWLERRGDETVAGRATVREGETLCLSFAFTRREIAVIPSLGENAVERVEETRQLWRGWADSCAFDGRDRHMIVRSALVLKQLAYSLSGAVVAAPTTSLPEVVGGVRNWDYRYCWRRDAAITFHAFVGLGFGRRRGSFSTGCFTRRASATRGSR